jgi:flagellar biosynthesis chaperone FliJ
VGIWVVSEICGKKYAMKMMNYHKPSFTLLIGRWMKLTVCLLMTATIYSQTVEDVLERGHVVKRNTDLYFKYDTILSFGYNFKTNKKNESEIDFDFQTDSVLLLTMDHVTDVYLKPLNPLRYSWNSSVKLVPDQISKAEMDALKSIGDLFSQVSTNENLAINQNGFVEKIKDDGIEGSLKSDHEEIVKINQIFNQLKGLKFTDPGLTRRDFDALLKETKSIKTHLDAVEKNLNTLKEKAITYHEKSKELDSVLMRYLFKNYVQFLQDVLNARNKQYSNLEKAVKLVETALNNAEANDWQFKLRQISVTKEENAIYTISIDTNAWNLDETGNLVRKTEGKLNVRTIIIRKYQLLVPEVSVGTYYTFFKYHVYGTTTDSTGQQYVGEPTFNTLKRFNASVMLNYNFYIPNSPIKPLLQFGGGVQAGVPIVMAGGGLRIGNTNAFSITGGVALTWVRELQTLKVGDRISGTTELENDLKYEFSFPLKGYIGIQYNF